MTPEQISILSLFISLISICLTFILFIAETKQKWRDELRNAVSEFMGHIESNHSHIEEVNEKCNALLPKIRLLLSLSYSRHKLCFDNMKELVEFFCSLEARNSNVNYRRDLHNLKESIYIQVGDILNEYVLVHTFNKLTEK